MSVRDISVTSRVRQGMKVRSSDGVLLGRVAEIWCGTDPKERGEECDETVCSRVEVRPPQAASCSASWGSEAPTARRHTTSRATR
ncbi:MAG: hypothetical protein M3P70_04535 [Actinomycetota bacterium]|nr:hypothetical protein [Actinomycetota bacterium]